MKQAPKGKIPAMRVQTTEDKVDFYMISSEELPVRTVLTISDQWEVVIY